MKPLIYLAIAFVFFWCGITQADLIKFGIVEEQGKEVELSAFVDSVSTLVPLHGVVYGEPAGNYNFKVEIEGVEAGQFTSVDAFFIGDEVIDYANNEITIKFSDLAGTISLSDPEVRHSDSFNLLFDVFQPNVGTSAYTLHWDTDDQPLKFANVDCSTPTASSPDQFILSFDLIFDDIGGDIDVGSPFFTTTFSGDFTPVPEPSSMLLLCTGLVSSLAGFRKKFRNQHAKEHPPPC